MKIEALWGEHVSDYARRLVLAAEEKNEVVEGEFNGTPMTAAPGKDDATTVELRWYDNRFAAQKEAFFRKVRELDAVIVDKRISSVNGKFERDGTEVVFIVLDDGTQLTASRVQRVLPAGMNWQEKNEGGRKPDEG